MFVDVHTLSFSLSFFHPSLGYEFEIILALFYIAFSSFSLISKLLNLQLMGSLHKYLDWQIVMRCKYETLFK